LTKKELKWGRKKSSTLALFFFTEEHSSLTTSSLTAKVFGAVTFTAKYSISSDYCSACSSESTASVQHTGGEFRARLLRINYLNI